MEFTAVITFVVLLQLSFNYLCEAGPLYETQAKILKQFSDTEAAVAPQVNSSSPLQVHVQFTDAHIVELSEKKGMMVTSLFPTLSWVDERLTWEEEVDMIPVSEGDIWTPSLDVLDKLEATQIMSIPRLLVYRNGTVFYTLHITANTPCSMNLVSFPFDTQYCHIELVSWSGSASTIEMHYMEPSYNISFYGDHINWKLLDMTITVSDFYDVVTQLEYSKIRMSIHASRSSSYYYRLFVAPAAVCLFVIPVVHFLPPSSNEKLTLGGLMLVAATIMFEMIEDFFPSTSLQHVPLILHYYTFLLISIFMSLLLSCMSVMIGTGESKSARVPRFLRICCIDRLGYICCARGRTSRYDYELLHLEKALRFSALRQTSREPDDEQELAEVTDEGEEATAANNHVARSTSEDGLKEVLKTLINELQYSRYKEQIKAEWLQLAMVIDRTGGLLLLGIAVIVTSVITLNTSS